ncbi:MAG: RNA polymerase sigma factor [Acetatifactor sp.]
MLSEMQKQLADYVVENQAKFYRLAYSYVGNREAAMDVVQNAVLKGIEHIETLKNPEYMHTWFYRVLINESINFIRQNRREIPCDYEELHRAGEKAAPEMRQETEVLDYVLKLPMDLKTIILLRFYEEKSLKEIAEIVDVKLSTVKYRLYRALDLLRKHMEEVSA